MTRLDILLPSLVRSRVGFVGARAPVAPILVLLLGLLGFVGIAGAVPTSGDEMVPTPDAVRAMRDATLPYGDGLLWKVQKPGAEPSYVFGTMHLNRDDVLAVPDAVKKALANARSASFEVLFDDDELEEMRRVKRAAGHHTLDALIGPDLFSDVVRAAEPYGLNVHQVRALQPWVLVFLFGKAPSVYDAEQDGKPVLDEWLRQQARKRGIPLFGLETIRQHFGAIMDLSPDEQRLMVKSLLKGLERDQTEVERAHAERVRLYLEGDIGALLAGTAEQDAELSPEEKTLNETFYRRMFDDRNHLMVERMLPRLEEGRAFVAVGAGHLPGAEGVISLLTERGYTVERIH